MKIKGLKKVCGESRKLKDSPGKRLQIHYNKKTKFVWCTEVCCSDVYIPKYEKCKDVVEVGYTDKYVSMETLKNFILESLSKEKRILQELEEIQKS